MVTQNNNELDAIVKSGVYHNKLFDRWELWEVDEETNDKTLLGFCVCRMGLPWIQILENDYRDWYLSEAGKHTKVKDFGVTIH